MSIVDIESALGILPTASSDDLRAVQDQVLTTVNAVQRKLGLLGE